MHLRLNHSCEARPVGGAKLKLYTKNHCCGTFIFMSVSDEVMFCDGCPYVPDGVTAKVDTVTYTDMAEYRRLRIAHELPGFVEDYLDTSITIKSTAGTSTNPRVEVGDEAVFRIDRAGQTEQRVVDAIRACHEPRKSRIAKALGQKGTCQAVTAK